MCYMLIHAAGAGLAPEQDDEAQASFSPWIEEAARSGAGLQGSRLGPAADSTTIKIRDGGLIITGGPYAETREQVAGYDVPGCASVDEAVRWAGRHPGSWVGAVEVRALLGSAPAVSLPGPGDGKIWYMMLVCTGPAVDPREFARIGPAGPRCWRNCCPGNRKPRGCSPSCCSTARGRRRG